MPQAHAQVIDFPRTDKQQTQPRSRNRLNAGKPGRVYARGGKLWVDFHYLGERVRESSGLINDPANRTRVRNMLDLIVSEIENRVFEFGKRFPHSKKVEHFTRLEGRTFQKDPKDILFKEYVEKWWVDMQPGMSASQVRDYTSILNTHLLPYFGDLTFSEFRPVLMKKFLAFLRTRETPGGTPLSPKRIHNILIPLRVIFRDACGEYDWNDLQDPFRGLKLPKVQRIRIQPFTIEEWEILTEFIPAWYRPYFEFAVMTGLRPSEQVALKWDAVDERFIHIELSRVRNLEKPDLKTTGSNRRIEITPPLRALLEEQKNLMAGCQSPYVFLNTRGRPVNQVSVRQVWVTALRKSGLPCRRMYETRHTFASWALAAGETVEWVARTLGHATTAMVHKTYGRYIPNLTRQDGSALERFLAGKRKRQPDRHNHRHNDQKSGCRR
jgi:integrase